jgi:hypothetical protein
VVEGKGREGHPASVTDLKRSVLAVVVAAAHHLLTTDD